MLGRCEIIDYNAVVDVDSTISLLRQNIERFRSFGVARLALFGSVVTGAVNDKSDIDVLVRFEERTKTFDNFMEVRFLIEELFPNTKIDLVLEEAIKPAIREQILSEATDVA